MLASGVLVAAVEWGVGRSVEEILVRVYWLMGGALLMWLVNFWSREERQE